MVVGTPASGGGGGRGRGVDGGWVVEGGGGGRGEGGLHSSNGMREPLSNRCRGGARSPRWLLRTLMSFSLDPLPPPPPPPSPSPVAPVRPTTHSTALASSSSTFDAAPRATRCYAAADAPSRSFTLIPQLLTAATVLLPPVAFLSFSPTPRERRP